MRLEAFVVVLSVGSVCLADDGPQAFQVDVPYRGRQTSVGIELEPLPDEGYRVHVDLGNGRVQTGLATVNSDESGVLDLTVQLSTPIAVKSAKGILHSRAFEGGGSGGLQGAKTNSFSPTSLRFKLARRGKPPLRARFYDKQGKELGRGTGQVDWDREVERRRDEFLRGDNPTAKRALDAARGKRHAADVEQINSKDPATIANATDRLRERLTTVEEQLQRTPSGTPTHKYLTQEKQEAERNLGEARKKRHEADVAEINSKDPAKIEKAVNRLGRRLADLEAWSRTKEFFALGWSKTKELAQASLNTAEAKFHSNEIRKTRQVLDEARKRRHEFDVLQIESGSLLLVNVAGERLSNRLKQLQARKSGYEQQQLPVPPWLVHDLQSTRSDLSAARKAKADLTP